ncbi:MAG: winged helix-turn-helix domain-containing protein, partial [Paludibacterium sp.]
LLEGRGNLVHKNTIIDKVWGESLVGDESLTRCIYSLRRLLRESKNNKFIETVYGKGYRFCKPVTPVQRQRHSTQASKLAILPFSGGERHEAALLHARLMDAISSRLPAGVSMVPAALTRGQDGPEALLSLCHQLELDCYLTGEFCQDGDQRLLTIELVDALGQSLLFRDTFLPDPCDTWSRQMDDIAECVLTRLAPQSSTVAKPALGEVMVSHVMARRCLRRRELGDLSLAQQYLQMGLLQDPLHVPSLVAMAETSLALVTQGSLWPTRAFSEARIALEKALELAPSQPAALGVMAWLTRLACDNDQVVANLFHQAREQNGLPAEVCFYQALYHLSCGEFDAALEMLHGCLARDSGFAPALPFKLWALHAMGRDEEAHAFALAQGEQGMSASLFQAMHALVLAAQGQHDSAHRHAVFAVQAAPGNAPEQIIQLWVGAMRQPSSEALQRLASWTAEAKTHYCCPGLLVPLALSLGEETRACALIRLAREQRCVWWPLVRRLPRMAHFLESLSPEVCWV